MPYSASPRPEIGRPIGNLFIAASVIAALFLNSLPWEGLWLLLRPDFVGLVLLYWCTHKPTRVGIGLSWAVGIFADVADASLFGQHALAYTVLAFGGIMLHHRLQMFDLRQQTPHVFAILAATYTAYALVHWQVEGYVVWPFFLGCLTSTLLWGPLSMLLEAVRYFRPGYPSRRS